MGEYRILNIEPRLILLGQATPDSAGEGAPFTGLKPSGTVEAAIAAADKALQAGSVDELAEKIGNAVGNEIKKRFIEVSETKKHAEESVEAGREFVEA